MTTTPAAPAAPLETIVLDFQAQPYGPRLTLEHDRPGGTAGFGFTEATAILAARGYPYARVTGWWEASEARA